MEPCLKALGDELQQVGHGHATRVKSLLPFKSIEEASLIMSQEASGEGTVWDSTSMELSCFWVRDNILVIDIKSRHLTENLWRSLELLYRGKEVKRATCIILCNSAAFFLTGGRLKGRNSHSSLKNSNIKYTSHYLYQLYRAFAALKSLTVPMISVVHGMAIGAGAAVVQWQDWRLTTSSALFDLNFWRLGISCGVGSTSMLISKSSKWKAAYDSLTSEIPMSAKEALGSGLVDEVVANKVSALYAARDLACRLNVSVLDARQGVQFGSIVTTDFLRAEAWTQSISFLLQSAPTDLFSENVSETIRFLDLQEHSRDNSFNVHTSCATKEDIIEKYFLRNAQNKIFEYVFSYQKK
jgi:enoyl-CoA hydratase/carnithine racemase